MINTTDDRPIGTLVTDAVDDLRAILDHERALAKAEIQAAARIGGIGAALLVLAVSLLSLVPIILAVTTAEAFVAAGLTRWSAYLLTAAIIVLVAVLSAAVGVLLVRRIGGPTRAIATTRETVTATVARLKTLGRPPVSPLDPTPIP